MDRPKNLVELLDRRLCLSSDLNLNNLIQSGLVRGEITQSQATLLESPYIRTRLMTAQLPEGVTARQIFDSFPGDIALAKNPTTPNFESNPAALVVVSETEPNNTAGQATSVPLGFDLGEDDEIDVTGTITSGDVDYYSVQLNAGDVLGTAVTGTSRIALVNSAGIELVGSAQNATSLYPDSSPLPKVGTAAFGWVVDTAGTYYVRLSGTVASYTANLRLFRPTLEQEDVGTVQKLFIDFNGATVDASIFGGSGMRTLSPLSTFLAGWGLTAASESAVIDAIMANLEENLSHDMRVLGNNGDYDATSNPGDFDIILLNSRDNPDPWGDPNVSRVIVGGSIAELGISTIGIAEDIDPGNFDTSSTAVSLLDLLSTVSTNANSLNQYSLAPGKTIIDMIGVGVGNVTAHEAGHFFGNWHTENGDAIPSIQDQGGNLSNTTGIGADRTLGTADDVDVDFGDDAFESAEGFTGTEDTLNAIAFGLSSGLVDPTTGDITGIVYQDIDGDGVRDPGENGLSGVTIFVDLDNDSTPDAGEPFNVTAGSGVYSLNSLLPGNYIVRQVAKPGYTITAPPAGFHSVTVTVGGVASNIDFANQPLPASISGTTWEDVDGDGTFDAGEPALPGVRVYLDANDNALFDAGEVNVLSSATGQYAFSNLAPGSYVVRQVISLGFQQTYPQLAAPTLWGVQPATGKIVRFSALNGAILGDFPAPAGLLSTHTLIGLTMAEKGASLVYMNSSVSTSTVYRLNPLTGAQLGTGSVGGWSIDGISFETIGATGYIYYSHTGGDVHRQAGFSGSETTGFTAGSPVGGMGGDDNGREFAYYTDARIYEFNPQTGARGNSFVPPETAVQGLAFDGATLYASYANGKVYALNPDTGAVIRSFTALGGGLFGLAASGTGVNDGAQRVTLVPGQDVVNKDFGAQRIAPGTINGIAWSDMDSDGVRDVGEPALSGWTIYVDANGNNTFDVGEVNAATNASGAYTLNVNPGTYRVALAQQSGYVITQPAAGYLSVVVGNGQNVANINFGNHRVLPGVISGVKWSDFDGDGVYDATEMPIQGVTIYLDLDNDQLLDAGEPSTQSDVNGAYSFTNLAPGTYRVREVVPLGYKQTFPFAGVGAGGTVAVFDNATYVDTGNTNSDESDTVQATLNLLAIPRSTFTGITAAELTAALAGKSALVIPELENASLLDGLVTAARQVIINFVQQGGGLIIMGDAGSRSLSLLNALFGFGIISSGTSTTGALHSLTAAATGTAFAGGPASIPENNETSRYTTSSLPAGSLSIYASGTNTTVASLPFGSGKIVLMGWDWYDAAPLGATDGGWSLVLQRAVSHVTSAGGAHSVTLVEGGDAAGLNFGNQQILPGSINGLVFNDLDRDGVRDAGEGILSGWSLFLDSNNNGVLDGGETSTTTNASGIYRFDVNPATYNVKLVQQAGYELTYPAAGVWSVTVANGQNVADVNFGNHLIQPATLAGVLWSDLDRDGVNDVGEPALQGWTIFLDTDADGVLDAGEVNTTTSASGAYSFSVNPGTYRVTQVLQAGYERMFPTSGNFYSATVVSMQQRLDLNFGNHQIIPGSISGTSWNDLDGDGVIDAGENPLAGMTVYLDLDNDRALDAGEPTSVTDITGHYSFINLQPGEYTVRELIPAGYEQTYPNQVNGPFGVGYIHSTVGEPWGSTTNIDHMNAVFGIGNWSSLFVESLTAASIFSPAYGFLYMDGSDNSFTEISAFMTANMTLIENWISLGGSLFINGAGNEGSTIPLPFGGVIDQNQANESVGTPVNASHPIFNGPLTPASGPFSGSSFSHSYVIGTGMTALLTPNGLAASAMLLSERSSGAGWLIAGGMTTTNFHTPATNAANLRRNILSYGATRVGFAGGAHKVTIVSGENETDLNFGSRAIISPTISGVTWSDSDRDGVRDAGEPLLAGQIVFIDSNRNGSLDAFEPTTFTDATGFYSFTVDRGSYAIIAPRPAGTQQTFPVSGVWNVTVANNQNLTNIDFGTYRIQNGTISGSVWNDVNRNATRDAGEAGLANWIVFLDADNDGSLDSGEAFTVSGIDGTYSFSVAPGTYVVAQILKTGFERTVPVASNYSVTVASEQVLTGRDFGNHLIQPAALAGVLWSDLDRDGVNDVGEPALQGWTIFLDTDADGVLDVGEVNTTTSASGAYSFSVNPGTYRVTQVLQAGYERMFPTSGNFYSATVVSMQQRLDLNFGNHLIQPGSISGKSWNDRDGDGVIDVGEGPLAGITVYLDLDGDRTLDAGEPSTLTDASGNYVFTNLMPREYIVRELLPAGFEQTSPNPLGGPFGVGYIRSTVGEPWGSTTNVDHMNAVFGVGSWSSLFVESLNAASIFSPAYGFLYMDGSDFSFSEISAFMTTNMTLIENWISLGGSLFINGAGNEGTTIPLPFGGVIDQSATNLDSVSVVNAAHPIFVGPLTPVTGPFTGGSFSHSNITATGMTPLLTSNGLAASPMVLAERAHGAGWLIAGGMTTTNFHSPQPNAANLRRNILSYGAGRVGFAGGAHRVTLTSGENRANLNFGNRDLVRVTGSNFEYETRHAVSFVLNENVAGTVTADDILLENLTTGAIIPPAQYTVTYDAAARRITVTPASGVWADADYRATLKAGSVARADGTPMALAAAHSFFVLAGDITGPGNVRDRIVDFSDLLVLAQNYGSTGKTYSQGNINYDAAGNVDFDDLLILAQHYGVQLGSLGLATQARTGVTKRQQSVAKELLA